MRRLLILSIVCFIFSVNIIAQNPAGLTLSLDGDGDYVNFGQSVQSNFDTSDFTIEFWLNKPNSQIEAIFGKREVCQHHSFWNSRMATRAGLEIDEDNSGTNYFSIASRKIVSDSSWHHVAFTRQDSILIVYFDGSLDTIRIGVGITYLSNSASLLIGDNPCVGLDGTYNFSGQIDEVRIWNKVRSNFQIRKTWIDTLGPEYYSTSDSGLVGYWRFDVLENLGINGDGADDVRDYSIYGNHGDLVGDAVLDTSGALVTTINKRNVFPQQFFLSQNYPNPFNPITNISFSLQKASNVELKIFDINGREVQLLVKAFKGKGNHTVNFDATNLASGIYYYVLKVENHIAKRKMLLIK